jgi:hypothetical protein
MKQLLTIILTTFICIAYGQDKYNHVNFNKLTEIQGTEYVIATIENWGKIQVNNQYLLFINSKNGLTKQVDFPKDAQIETIKQVKIDSLGINKIIVAAKTIDLNGIKGIEWTDPQQIIVLSTDGQEKTQLTDNKFYVSTWVTNMQTGTIIITGYYDSDNNNKYNKTDKNEILIYDLRTLKLLNKI